MIARSNVVLEVNWTNGHVGGATADWSTIPFGRGSGKFWAIELKIPRIGSLLKVRADSAKEGYAILCAQLL